MPTRLKFNGTYFIAAVLIFVVEVLIAKYVHDRIIRPYAGDMLVVILLYTFVKAFVDGPVVTTALGVLAFACMIEALQYFRIVEVLGLRHSRIARIVIGTAADWSDVLAYICGFAVVLFAELVVLRKPAG